MLIKHKLMLNIVCFISALLIMLGILFFTLNKAAVEVRITRQLADVEYEVSQLSHHQKNFVQLKDEAYVTAFERSIKKIKQDIQSLEKDLGEFGLDISSIKQVEQRLVFYQSLFLKVVEQQKLIGLHPKDGLYGSLRSSVHAVEEILGKNDFELLSGMLQLRRNEKDYMLRLDDKYVTRLQNNTNLLVGKVENSGQSSALKSDIVKLLRAYEADFLNLVSAQKLLGYRHDDAMLGEMQAVVLDIDKRLILILNTTHDHVEAQTASVKTFAFIVLALVIVFAVTLSSFISRSVISVITEMRDLMRRVASTNDLTLSAEIKGNDELTEMSKVFNDMLETFRHLIIEANQSVQTVNTATQSLAQNISVANDGVDTQMQQTDMVATAVTQMVATINEIAQNTEEAANKAHSTTENAERGKSGVDTTIDQIKVLSESLSKSESIVSELYKDSHTIGTVLDVIRGIAEQTNLLALNAAIEAARAGEQGRGFAVVADEVRTLASRTQDSTKEIESIILSLQDRTQKIVEYMDTCRKQGNESAEQASSAGQMLEEITADVALIQDMNSAIATAIQQQSSVASEVNEHVVMIRDVTEQSADSSKQNEYMSEELSQQASVLHKEVSRFKV